MLFTVYAVVADHLELLVRDMDDEPKEEGEDMLLDRDALFVAVAVIVVGHVFTVIVKDA